MPRARKILALNVRAYRAKLGWTQEHLALETGLHRTFIAHVEVESRNISLDNLEKIAVAFGISLSELLAEELGSEP
jgi:transcriptional regulator with XRE-family HTH domain